MNGSLLHAWLVGCALAAAATAAFALKDPVRLWDEVYVRVRPGATVQARFHFSVQPGYFVVAGHAPASGQLRPLALKMKPTSEVQVGKPGYPASAASASIEGLAEFPVYEGVIAVSVPITVPEKATWTTLRLEGTLEYQACTATGCAEPGVLPVTIEVELKREAATPG